MFEPIKCNHSHSWNYDPAKVVIGQPVQALPNSHHLCMDCGELFQPQTPERRYTIAQIKQVAGEFAISDDDFKLTRQIVLSAFLAWLAKREQGKEGLRDDDNDN